MGCDKSRTQLWNRISWTKRRLKCESQMSLNSGFNFEIPIEWQKWYPISISLLSITMLSRANHCTTDGIQALIYAMFVHIIRCRTHLIKWWHERGDPVLSSLLSLSLWRRSDASLNVFLVQIKSNGFGFCGNLCLESNEIRLKIDDSATNESKFAEI